MVSTYIEDPGGNCTLLHNVSQNVFDIILNALYISLHFPQDTLLRFYSSITDVHDAI